VDAQGSGAQCTDETAVERVDEGDLQSVAGLDLPIQWDGRMDPRADS
jgi:hypothetical protein